MPWQIVYGIVPDAVYTHLKMQVVACCPTRRAYVGDLLTLSYPFTHSDMQIAAMTVNRHNAIVMLYHNAVSVAVVPLRQDNCSRIRSYDGSSVGSADINTRMSVISAVPVYHLIDLTAVLGADRPVELSVAHILNTYGKIGRQLLGSIINYLRHGVGHGDPCDLLAANLNSVYVGYVRGHSVRPGHTLLISRIRADIVCAVIVMLCVIVGVNVVGFQPCYRYREERLFLVDKKSISHIYYGVLRKARVQRRNLFVSHSQGIAYSTWGVPLPRGIISRHLSDSVREPVRTKLEILFLLRGINSKESLDMILNLAKLRSAKADFAGED